MWVFLKLALIVYYLGIYVMSLEVRGTQKFENLSNFFVLTTINLVFFPFLSAAYSYALLKGRLN
jgi:hypothetical protein